MKNLILILLLALGFASCVSDRPWVDRAERFRVSDVASNYFAPNIKAPSYAMDSTLYDKLISKGTSSFCAMVTAYSMSEVQLERELPNRCHSQFYNFESVSAEMLDDTIMVMFKTQNLRRSIASNKLIKVKILENDHTSEIIHWGTETREIERYDGTTQVRRSPSSEIISTRLKLNKKYYELGDTLIGEIKIASYQVKGRRKTKIKEVTKGKFRTIVGGFGVECTPEKALATSWLED